MRKYDVKYKSAVLRFRKFNNSSQALMFFLYSVNGQYVKQGKVGAAVLGNHTTKEVRTYYVIIFES